MTYKEYPTLEQGSDTWVAARCGILTASQIGKLITPTLKVASNDTSRALTETLVAERLTGQVDFIFPNTDMQRGTLDEPYAREHYAEHYAGDDGPVTELGFATREIGEHKLGASPDALVGSRGGLEIKSRRPKTHVRTIIAGTVPAENLPQIHACMTVFDREWWDYLSYAGGFPAFVKRVYRDDAWRAVIRDALNQFEDNAARMINTYKQTVGDKPVAPRIDHFADEEMSF